jgi:hypothetical protein
MVQCGLLGIPLIGEGFSCRILANRQSAQRSRVRKLQYISELEMSVNALQVSSIHELRGGIWTCFTLAQMWKNNDTRLTLSLFIVVPEVHRDFMAIAHSWFAAHFCKTDQVNATIKMPSGECTELLY